MHEQEAHHETTDVFQDIETVEPLGGRATTHQATVIWLHGMGEDGNDWRRQLVHTIGKGRYVTALPVSTGTCAPLLLSARIAEAGAVAAGGQGVRWLFPTAKLRRYPLYGNQPLCVQHPGTPAVVRSMLRQCSRCG